MRLFTVRRLTSFAWITAGLFLFSAGAIASDSEQRKDEKRGQARGEAVAPRGAPGGQRPEASAPRANPGNQPRSTPEVQRERRDVPRGNPNAGNPRSAPDARGGERREAPRMGNQPHNTPDVRGGDRREAPRMGNQPHNTPDVRGGDRREAPRVGGMPRGTPNARDQRAVAGHRPEGRNNPMVGKRLPSGDMRRQADGSATLHTRSGGNYNLRPDGSVRNFQGRNHTEANFRRDGSVRTMRSRDMMISHNPLGGRRVIRERADHTMIVSHGHGYGYVQHPFHAYNHNFVARSFYGDHGRYVHYYQPHRYHGVDLYFYTPGVYYPPPFYGWALTAWSRPAFYGWGWRNDPWYTYYGDYFTPYPSYSGASLWLTDYMLAAALEKDYNERLAAMADEGAFPPPVDSGQVGISPEVKQSISTEIRQQLAAANADSQLVARNGIPDPETSGLPRLLSDNQAHYFVVSSALDVAVGTEECTVTPGDILRLYTIPSANDPSAILQVMASKSTDCRRGSLVTVSLADLQEMQNSMRETIDQGLAELQAKQGQAGIPAAPAGATTQIQASFATSAPPPDPNDAALLSQQDAEGNRAEQEVLGEAFEKDATPPGGAPATITLGQSIGEVTAILGQPQQIVNLGAKQIYVYKNMKVHFTDGKVTDVQ